MTTNDGYIETDEAGNVTVHAPTATAAASALTPGVETQAPEFIVYMHEGKPVLYQRYTEEV